MWQPYILLLLFCYECYADDPSTPTKAPADFTVVAVTGPEHVIFRWAEVSNDSVNGCFKGYKLETWTEDDSEHKSENLIQSDTNVVTLNNLKPATKYFAHVMAYNERYNGPASNSASFTTLDGIPGLVESLDVVPLGSSAFWLTWKPPLEPNGNITGYIIAYQKLDRFLDHRKRYRQIRYPQITSVKLTGLEQSTTYEIKIRARTSGGAGQNKSIKKDTLDLISIVPDIPNFTCVKFSNNLGVIVKWQPSGLKSGSHFFARYRKKGELNWETTEHEKDNDFLVIHRFDPDSTYEIRVTAVDGEYVTESQSQFVEMSS